VAVVPVRTATSSEKDGHDSAVQTKSLREDENKHHRNVHTGLLSDSTNTSVTSNTDSHTSSNSTQTDSQTSGKIKEAADKSVLKLNVRDDHDADDDTVDRNDTGEDDRKDTLHDDFGLHDTEGGDTERRLGNAISRAKVGQAHGERNAEGAKEGRV